MRREGERPKILKSHLISNFLKHNLIVSHPAAGLIEYKNQIFKDFLREDILLKEKEAKVSEVLSQEELNSLTQHFVSISAKALGALNVKDFFSMIALHLTEELVEDYESRAFVEAHFS